MAEIFLDPFEDPPETEGEAPTQWDSYGGYTFDNREVDDVRAHVGSLSCWLKARAGGNSFCGAPTGAYTTERVRTWVYFEDEGKDFRIISCVTGPGYISTRYMAYVMFSTDGKIYYYDTGANEIKDGYGTGWHYIDIYHDWDANTYDIYYDGVLLQADCLFFSEQVGAGGAGINIFMGAGADNEVWMDDVQVGEDECAVSPAQAGPMAGGVTI